MRVKLMRIHTPCHIAALIFALALPASVPAQLAVPDYVVRLTLRDSSGVQRVVGHLTVVTSDSLVLRVADSDSLVGVDRRQLLRVERHSGLSIDKAMASGCLVFGAVFALAGSQVQDPDSPGIGKAVAVAGFLVGCGLGALGGAIVTWFGQHHGWEEITV